MKGIFILIVILALGSCQENRESTTEQDKTALEFRTDGKLETLYIAFHLADYPVVTPHESSYKSAVLERFNQYREHQAIQILRKIMYQDFNFDYAVNWLYQHTDFPAFENSIKIEYAFGERPMNADTLELFRKELIKFYSETRCDSFLESQKDFFTQITNSVRNGFERKDIIQVIEGYFGVSKNADYFVILSPLLHSGGFAIERADKSQIFALIGPSGVKDSIPVFDKAFLEYDLVIHEFSHNYANAIVDEFMAETKQFEPALYTPIQEKLQNEGCGNWENFMYELIVRTTTIKIVENIYGKEAASELVDYEKSVGFEYVVELAELLKEYENQRGKYPTLKDFFPEIIKGLERIKNERPIIE